MGGTQNVILASALGEGQVVIENAALEPEIADLAEMLNRMGARIRGAGSERPSHIEGVVIAARRDVSPCTLTASKRAHLCSRRRRRAVKWPCAMSTQSTSAPSPPSSSESGVRVSELDAHTLYVDATGPLKPTDVTASEYPGLPTDLQAPFGAFLATVPGVSILQDRVYPDRFTHVGELARTGAQLELRERTLVVQGGALTGTQMHAADIRAGGALVVAALAASGESAVTGVRYIERGYEGLEERLRALGAHVMRGQAPELVTRTYND